jgi:hypothetical protein
MSKLRCHISVSLDGFVAGPNQSEENPLGEGGAVNESAGIVEESRENIGAGVMGRNMRPGPRRPLGRRAVDGLVGRRSSLLLPGVYSHPSPA